MPELDHQHQTNTLLGSNRNNKNPAPLLPRLNAQRKMELVNGIPVFNAQLEVLHGLTDRSRFNNMARFIRPRRRRRRRRGGTVFLISKNELGPKRSPVIAIQRYSIVIVLARQRIPRPRQHVTHRPPIRRPSSAQNPMGSSAPLKGGGGREDLKDEQNAVPNVPHGHGLAWFSHSQVITSHIMAGFPFSLSPASWLASGPEQGKKYNDPLQITLVLIPYLCKT